MEEEKVITYKKAERNSSIEVLRIVAILFILIHHWCVNLSLFVTPQYDEGFYLFFQSLSMVGKVGVMLFFIISGYGMAKSTALNWKKFIRICLEVTFFAMGWFIVDIILIKNGYLTTAEMGFDPDNFTSMFLATKFYFFTFAGAGAYWFVTVYLLVFLLAPFLNKAILHINKKAHLTLVIIMFVLVSLFPTFGINGLAVQCLLGIECYIAGTFIRLHLDDIKKYKYLGLAIGLFFLLFRIFSTTLFIKSIWSDPDNYWLNTWYSWLSNEYSVPTYLASFGLAMFFASIEFKCKTINIISSTTYGIYLFHSGPAYKFMEKFFKFEEFPNSALTFSHVFGSFCAWVIGLFVVGCLVDLFRQYCLERPLFKFGIDKLNIPSLNLDEE